MKSLSLFALSTLLFGLVQIGCERHSFDDTKKLHLGHGHHEEGHGQGHGGHGEAADAHHGDAHAKKDEAPKSAEEAAQPAATPPAAQ